MSNSSAARPLFSVSGEPELRPKIVLPYERVSAVMGRDDEAFRSPDIQRAANLAAIAAAGAIAYPDAIENPERYRDIDRTGRDFNRDGIQRALDLKRRGLIDGIAVLDVSRVGRTSGETLQVIEEFRDGERGVFLSSRERIDDSPTGELLLTIMVALAQLYSDTIALGWRSVIVDRFERGLHNGNAPFGYDHVRHEDGTIMKPARIIPDPTTAPLVVEAFRRYDAGESATAVREWLRSLGHWKSTSMTRLFRNPFYLGDVRLFVYTGKAKKRVKLKDAADNVMQGPGQHEPILLDENGRPDRALFDRVQRRLDTEEKYAKRHRSGISHALATIAVCAYCGRSLINNKVRGVPHLRDTNGKQNGCDGMGAARIDWLEAIVLDEVRRLCETLRVDTGEHAARMQARERDARERAALQRNIEKWKSAITDADADLYTDDITRERHAAVTKRFAEKIADAEAAIAALPEPNDDDTSPSVVLAAAERVVEEWDDATPDERRTLLRAARVRKVVVREAKRWHEPLADRVEVVFDL